MQILVISTVIVFSLCHFNANATFYIDYQGIDKEPQKQKGSLNVPDGYKFLTDQYRGVIQQIGEGEAKSNLSFGDSRPLKDALAMILPSNWVAYIDESDTSLPDVTWDTSSEPLTELLARLGADYGLQFVIDWDQSLLQISKIHDFEAVDFNTPTIMTNPKTGRQVFIYSKPHNTRHGHLMVDGKFVQVKIQD